MDSSLMNYLFRPEKDGFDDMCIWKFNMEYELKLKSSIRSKHPDDEVKDNCREEDEVCDITTT
jgi:hypothetical protein